MLTRLGQAAPGRVDGHGGRLGEDGLLIAHCVWDADQGAGWGDEGVAEAAADRMMAARLGRSHTQHAVPPRARWTAISQAAGRAIIRASPAHHAVARTPCGLGWTGFDDIADHFVAQVNAAVRGQRHGRDVEAGVEENLVQVAAANAAQAIAHTHPVGLGQGRIR